MSTESAKRRATAVTAVAKKGSSSEHRTCMCRKGERVTESKRNTMNSMRCGQDFKGGSCCKSVRTQGTDAQIPKEKHLKLHLACEESARNTLCCEHLPDQLELLSAVPWHT